MPFPPLLLLHGYPFDHTMWDHVAALLATKTRLLTPDLRGFGGQPVGEREPSLDVMADDLVALLDKAAIGRVVVGGMSMGGYAALAFAQHHPARLAGLALISTQAVADTEQARAGRQAMIEKVRQEGSGSAARAAMEKLFAPRNAGKSELTRFPLQGAIRAGVEGIVWGLQAMAGRPDRSEVLRNVKAPVLVLHGEEDQFIPCERAREMAQLASDTRFVAIAGAGHATPLEAPTEVARALEELLARANT